MCVAKAMHCTCDLTICGEIQVGRSEIGLKHGRDPSRDATVSSGVFRMRGSGCERCPLGIGCQCWIATTSSDGGYGPPKAKVILGIEAADYGVGVCCPEHGHQASCLRSVKALLRSQPSEHTAVLLAGVFGPEEADLGLLRRAHSAVDGAQRFDLVVVVDPLLRVKRRRSFIGEKLVSAGHGERNHLAQPWRYRRSECRRSSLPKPGPHWRSVENISEETVVRTRRDQGLGRLLSNGDAGSNVRTGVIDLPKRRREL